MTQREQARLQVLNSLLAGHMTMDQAATLMGVSTRHTRRILAAYREEGAAALSHGNRGLRATNATPETTKTEVLRLARSRYSETNHTHLSELLREREGHRHRSDHAAAHTGGRRREEPRAAAGRPSTVYAGRGCPARAC